MASTTKRQRSVSRTATISQRRKATSALALAPTTVTPNGVPSPQAGALSASNGDESLVWARYDVKPFSAGYISGWQPFYGTPGSEISRERALVSSIALDLLHSNAVIAGLVESLSTYAVGQGLTLSSKPNADALGISREEARALSHQIETAWASWVNNPLEVDSTGRFTLHQLATTVFKHWLLTGEAFFTLDHSKPAGATSYTKISLLDSRQLDQSITRIAEGNNGGNIFQGVQFSKDSRVEGYWIRKAAMGNISTAPQAVFVKARTTWGRLRVGHLFDMISPGQIRGLSPLAPALTPAQSKRTLQEFNLIQALVQSMAAITVESDLTRDEALRAINKNDPTEVLPGGVNRAGNPSAGASPVADWMAAAGPYYEKVKVEIDAGKVVHMMKGDRLVMHRSQAPNQTYESFDRSLLREAAKAAGSSYEDASGDYSQTSFSASRLATEAAWRINLRRRGIIEGFYRGAFMGWLEEMCETGVIRLKKGMPSFWEAPGAYYGNTLWRGSPKPVADPLKQSQSEALRLETGLATYEQVLGEYGFDVEEVIAQRKAEREQLEAAGLPYPVPKNRSDDFKAEDDTPEGNTQ